jgi:hypothetical protein
LLYELYTWEKMRELESEARARTPGQSGRGRPAPTGASLARLAGRSLKRFGASLEDWAEAEPRPSECCEGCG